MSERLGDSRAEFLLILPQDGTLEDEIREELGRAWLSGELPDVEYRRIGEETSGNSEIVVTFAVESELTSAKLREFPKWSVFDLSGGICRKGVLEAPGHIAMTALAGIEEAELEKLLAVVAGQDYGRNG